MVTGLKIMQCYIEMLNLSSNSKTHSANVKRGPQVSKENVYRL